MRTLLAAGLWLLTFGLLTVLPVYVAVRFLTDPEPDPERGQVNADLDTHLNPTDTP